MTTRIYFKVVKGYNKQYATSSERDQDFEVHPTNAFM